MLLLAVAAESSSSDVTILKVELAPFVIDPVANRPIQSGTWIQAILTRLIQGTLKVAVSLYG